MDVVIFELNMQHFAFPAAEVHEVLDPLPVTKLPFAPDYVDGLVSVAGQVVVQMDAATRLGVGGQPAADKGCVLVINASGATSAVHVEKVLTKASVADEEISLCGVSSSAPEVSEQDSSEQDLPEQATPQPMNEAVNGEFQWKGIPVLLLDAGAFSLDGIAAQGVPSGGGGLLGSSLTMEKDGKNEESVSNDFPCVIVECNAERYAIRLHEVGEIVEVGGLTALPHAPGEVAGMTLLRGTPLLGLSLGMLLGGRDGAAQPVMVVVESRGMRFGLLTEKVIGIERFKEGSIQTAEQGMEVEGYLIGKGEIMVGLLRLNSLISEARFTAYSNYLVKNRLGNIMEKTEVGRQATQRMLTFQLGLERCAMPLEWVERVEEYHEKTGVPGGDDAGLSGVVQIQGEVAPVVDLRREMGFPCTTDAAAFLVVRLDGGIWALSVDRVERVVEIRVADIEQVKCVTTDYIGSVGRVNGKLISILTLEPLKKAA